MLSTTSPGPSDITDADDEQLRLLKLRLAEPVITSLLTAAELERVSVHWDWDWDRTNGETWVRIVACGEVFQDWLTSPVWGAQEDVGDGEVVELQAIDLPLCAARLADHLQDWIAESRFGWGQQRTARYTLPA